VASKIRKDKQWICLGYNFSRESSRPHDISPSSRGIAHLGWAASLSAGDYLRAITTLDAQELKRMSLQDLRLVDSKECIRLVDEIL